MIDFFFKKETALFALLVAPEIRFLLHHCDFTVVYRAFSLFFELATCESELSLYFRSTNEDKPMYRLIILYLSLSSRVRF